MIELLLTTCSVLHGAACKDVSLIYSDVSLLQCQIGMMAQSEVAKWMNEHPNWRVEKYRCQVPGTFAKI